MGFVYGGSFTATTILAVGVDEEATVGVFCDCLRLWLLLIVQGLMCAESLGCFFLPLRCPLALRFCPRVMITGCFGVTASLRGA